MGKSKRKVLWQEGYIQVFVDEKGNHISRRALS